MPAFELYDRRYRDFVPGNSLLEKLWTGGRWLEGTVYFGDADHVLFSDIPNNRMLRWVEGGGVSVFRASSNYSNGNTRDREGRLVTCQHGTRSVTRTEPDGTITTLADRWKGKRLNSPNDVVVKSDGTVWFTDPPYGILTDYEGYKAESEIGASYVFRLDPRTGDLDVVADDFERPNGLAFSPDESRLYVSDTSRSEDPNGPPLIRVFDVVDGGKLARGQRFADMKQFAFGRLPPRHRGQRLDERRRGRQLLHARAGSSCCASRVPERVANVCFGGPKRNRLFIAGHTSLYSIFVGKNGVQKP